MMMNKNVLVAMIGVAVLLAACGPQLPASGSAGPNSWIDKPLANSTIPEAPYEVVSHASSQVGVASFELSVDGQVISVDDAPADSFGETLAYIRQMWTPPGPGTYELAVRAFDAQGEAGPQTSVRVNVGELAQPERASPTAVTGAPTRGTEAACTFEAAVNLFCRPGPGYEPVDSLVPGQQASVIGMSQDGVYWYLEGPLSGLPCSVPVGEQYGQVSGVCSGLPAFTPMPPVTETPTPTLTPTATPSRSRSPAATPTPTIVPPA